MKIKLDKFEFPYILLTDWLVIMNCKNIDLKTKILNNAAKKFAEKGFFSTTVEEIAHASGISKGTVYLYFKDKETLYIEVIDNFFQQGLNYLEIINKMNLSSIDKLNRIIFDWNKTIMKNKFFFPIISIENINFSQKIFKMMKKRIEMRIMQIFSEIEGIIKEGIEKNEIKNVNTKFVTLYFMEIIRIPVMLSFIYKNEKVKPDDIFEIFLNGIKRR